MQPMAEELIPFDDTTAAETTTEVEAVGEGAVADVTPASELPDWLQDLQPSAAAAELTPAEALPEWLRNLQPESIEVMADQAAVSEPVVEPPHSEEAPVAAQPVATQPEVVEPLAEGLPEPIITPIHERMKLGEVEVKPEPVALPAAPVALTWWTQSAEDEGEAPIAELPAPVRTVSTTARPLAVPGAPAVTPRSTVAPRTPITRAMRDRLPERSTRETRRRDVRSAEPRRTETSAPIASSVNVDPLVEQLEADKFNHVVRLELARAWWSMGNRDSALAEYGKLINPAQVENLSDEELAEIEERDFADAGPLANELIVDLERIVEIDDHPAWPRLLGDVYMKTGDLAQALEMYRRALSQL
jgi:tetratricopeptide (TPR) repeat protein